MQHIELVHDHAMAFDLTIDGHSIRLDAAPEHGGEDLGPRPKPLLLASLAGCTAMDVVSILKKMRQTWTRLAVSADGELTDDHPRVFTSFDVRFEVEGPVDPGRLARAVALSRDRYCGVSAMLRAHAPVTVTVVLNGETIDVPTA